MIQEITKSRKLDHVAYDVRGPVVDAAATMEAQGEKILKLNIGNPAPFGFTAPPELVEAMHRELEHSQGYSDSRGLLHVRESIAGYHRDQGITDIGPGDVYTGNGVSELINLCMQALLDTGDEILIPSPDYPLWTATATLAGGTVVHYCCDEQSDWAPDLSDIRRKITPHTRAIVIINPNNPTGALYSRELLLEIAQIARENGLMIFADEIYSRLVMDGAEHISIASLCPDVFCVTFNGLSKSHLIAGYRAGWMILSGDRKRAAGYIEGLNMLSNMRLCANVPAQHSIPAALNCLDAIRPLLAPGGRIYEQRRVICSALNQIPGISVVWPKAAFYCFPRIDRARFGITSDEQFVLDFLHQKKVLLVAGCGFHWPEPDHFRIVYLPDISVLTQSAEKLARFLETYRQNP